MAINDEKFGWFDRFRRAFQELTNDARVNSNDAGLGNASSFTDHVYKAVIPNFLYKPPFGYPLFKDIPEIRRMARVPHVVMVTNTVCNEIAGLDWDIFKHEDFEDDVPDEIILKTKNWFLNPNRNDESFEQIIRALVRDIVEIDAGVIVKVRNFKDELCEIYVRDGGTFTKSPDVFGVMPEKNAYYQYGWLAGARPVAFNRNEIAYFMVNPRSDSIYGQSNIEVLMNVLQLLTYGIDANLEYFTDNNIPKGVFKMINANSDDIKAFKQAWSEQMKTKDSAGKWRKLFHKMPIINTDGAFERIAFSNVEMEFIQQQEWFVKLVWACFSVNPSELGFTDDSNRATEMVQSSIFKRKLIRPLTQLLEYQFNTLLVNDLPWIKGKYEGKVLFEFSKFDTQEELNRRQIVWGDLEKGLRTVNECREEIEYEALPGGDELRNKFSGSFEGFNPFSKNVDEDKSGAVKKEFVAEEDLFDFGLKSVQLKHKYIKRTGSTGNYKYFYREDLSKVGGVGVSKEVVDKTREIMKELESIVENFDDFTTSDLQGAVEVIAKKYNADSDKMLDYVYEKVDGKKNSGSVGSGKSSSVEDDVKDLRSVASEVDTSDLQGVTSALAKKFLGAGKDDFSKKELRSILNEADDVLLSYAYGDIELDEVNKELGRLKEEFSKASKTESKSLFAVSEVDIDLEKELVNDFKEIKKKIKANLKEFDDMLKLYEVKAVGNDLIKKFISFFNFDLSKYAVIVKAVVRKNYVVGVDVVEKEVEKNFMPDMNAIGFLESYTFDNIKGLVDELRNDLRQELERGVLNGEGINQITKRVDKVLDNGVVRAKMIARTESLRARNMGELNSWKDTGLDLEKGWLAKIDNKTSPVCRALNGKWVGINDVFEWKGQEFQAPPSHSNCRSSLIYRVKDKVRK